jgi:hypothetical protein
VSEVWALALKKSPNPHNLVIEMNDIFVIHFDTSARIDFPIDRMGTERALALKDPSRPCDLGR